MDARSLIGQRRSDVWLDRTTGTLDDFRQRVERVTQASDWPLACEIVKNMPVYSGETVRAMADEISKRRELSAEWCTAFDSGPGVIAVRNAVEDHAVIDRASNIFADIIEQEKREQKGGGDHFAKPGANDRIWNALEKHCIADPENFARYYANDTLAMVSEAWLGKGYQVTAQVNRVNPGGAAQTAHRDYHLGFMSAEQQEAFPAHVHRLSPMLTLQGALAHCDIPIEGGPTMLLPYSQSWLHGYIAFERPEFQEYFNDNAVQLALKKGDMVFFNPALMHAAGHNRSRDILRLVNLFQVSSPFGRAIETVDRSKIGVAVYPVLLAAKRAGTLTDRAIANTVAVAGEGYPFPTNLDLDPPIGGMAPKSPVVRIMEALDAEMSLADFEAMMKALDQKRIS